MKSTDVLVTGSGSLAAACVHALLGRTDRRPSIAIIGRDSSRLLWLKRSAEACGRARGLRCAIQTANIDWQSRDCIVAALKHFRPRAVLHTASLQSPWSLGGSDRWSLLVRGFGYGLTLPLHLRLAQVLGEVIKVAFPSALFINACYPDAVNPMLRAGDIPVLCGIGNAATLGLLLAAEAGCAVPDVQLVAHHAHLASSTRADRPKLPQPMVWLKGRVSTSLSNFLVNRAMLPTDATINRVNAATAALALDSLLGIRAAARFTLPGPCGMQGGYPVYVQEGRLSISIPAGCTVARAMRLNAAAAEIDGAVVRSSGVAEFCGRVRVPGDVRREFGAMVENLSIAHSERRSRLMLEFRKRLA